MAARGRRARLRCPHCRGLRNRDSVEVSCRIWLPVCSLVCACCHARTDDNSCQGAEARNDALSHGIVTEPCEGRAAVAAGSSNSLVGATYTNSTRALHGLCPAQHSSSLRAGQHWMSKARHFLTWLPSLVLCTAGYVGCRAAEGLCTLPEGQYDSSNVQRNLVQASITLAWPMAAASCARNTTAAVASCWCCEAGLLCSR